MPAWDAKTQLDSVNSAAHKLGVCPRQTIAQATSIVGSLSLHSLPRACISAALKQVAEVALGFGSPVSFQAPDTVWVDVTGSSHLFPGERELALELVAHIRALGHKAQAAMASGPWLAQSFARYSACDQAGIFIAEAAHTTRDVGNLPIMALPIGQEVVTWFSRLGLLSIDDLRKLPQSALAARFEGQVFQRPAFESIQLQRPIRTRASCLEISVVLDLIRGCDNGVLIPYQPEEMPCEELCWDEPLESIEPLLFVLKRLSGRLSARLEGRGQATQDLLLTIHYDRSIAALRNVLPALALDTSGERYQGESVQPIKQLPFKLASPLVHAEDLERIVRSRLQRLNLLAPAIGLSLQATSVTEARHWQMDLRADVGLSSEVASDPRAMAVLVAELAADLGDNAVGVLVANDSHLMEKSSELVPIQKTFFQEAQRQREAASTLQVDNILVKNLSPDPGRDSAKEPRIGIAGQHTWLEPLRECKPVLRLPTRLLASPVELGAPIRKNELWVLRERAFVVRSIQFDQRLEAVEWWGSGRVFRDYFRIWLAAVESRQMAREHSERRGHFERRGCSERQGHSERQGIEALVYWDREGGKSYIQALYD